MVWVKLHKEGIDIRLPLNLEKNISGSCGIKKRAKGDMAMPMIGNRFAYMGSSFQKHES